MTRRATMPEGLVLESHKHLDYIAPIIELPAPIRVVLAVDQGSGRGSTPVVARGEQVAFGTLLARADDPFACDLHASIAGNVVAVETCEAATASGESLCIVLERDPAATRPSAGPVIDWTTADPEVLRRELRAAGIAGLGGAAFPTATKLAAARGRSVHTLLVNGAECEPWISCDDAVMQAAADDVVLGAGVLQRAIGATTCTIAIEDDKPAAIAAVTDSIQRNGAATASLVVVPAVYPRGAERQLVTAVTGVEVPSGGLPVDAGIVCLNVSTAAAVARWAICGEPLVSRVVTVTGSGVARPCNVRAPIGTPLAELVQAAGGYCGTPLRLIAGGCMTGRALASDAIGLTKAMNCIFVATRADIGSRLGAAEMPCIRCGDCAQVCPAGLLPQQLHRAALVDGQVALRQLGLHDCIDCGLCDYVCPSQIPLAHRFRSARQRLLEADLIAARSAAARERHERHERRLQETAVAEQRAFEDVRARARQASDGGGPGGNDQDGTA